ncbi:hypothetical protein Osc7112_3144 [Oscillatoria nigro-viridis PCC 7112]|uniref:Uncharacterized protein n=1 Tax=Phormidium nigroviride PCC 7112 TaxID=179408 RepID=K9VJZ6_9CYAN|nr:hypothetical protein Osc7112_3144 [Oscillatoria nigro-viridis PCC 7112]
MTVVGWALIARPKRAGYKSPPHFQECKLFNFHSLADGLLSPVVIGNGLLGMGNW